MTIPVQSQPQPVLQDALAWLKAPPAGDPLHDLAALRQYLKETAEAAIQPVQRLKLLELLQGRADSTSVILRPRLLDATLPLPHRLRTIAQGLLDVRGLLASAQLASLHQLAAKSPAISAPDMADHCARVLANVAEQQQIALTVSTTMPNGLWLQAQEALRLLEAAGASPDAGHDSLKTMLALVAAQPEAFTAREVCFLIEYLRQFGSAVEVANRPVPPLEHWYWLEQSRDLPPVAIARRQPPSQGVLLYFSCATLGKVASQHLIQLANGRTPEELHLPAGSVDEYREVLIRAQQRWSSVPRRHSHRRPSHYRVEICARMQSLWNMLRDGEPAKVSGDDSPITDWMVLNESPSGFALMHVSGTIDDMAPGDALGLRTAPGRPWNIGLIRWARSDNPEHFELGLEMISPMAIPVEAVQPRAEETRRCPAFLFPAVSGLDRNETLMTRRGQLDAGAFTLIRQTDEKLQVTQCEMHHLVLQTSKIEIFEFRRNFAPE
jgi:hypothetical protein